MTSSAIVEVSPVRSKQVSAIRCSKNPHVNNSAEIPWNNGMAYTALVRFRVGASPLRGYASLVGGKTSKGGETNNILICERKQERLN
jgi:hypothetical protein